MKKLLITLSLFFFLAYSLESVYQEKIHLRPRPGERTHRNLRVRAPANDAINTSLPTHWDWRELGKVTPVKNQGACGSCWAFAEVAAVESKILILANLEMDLSEQQLVSCSGAGGCSGGYFEVALNYIRDYGLVSESCFPYQAADVSCTLCEEPTFAKIEGWYRVTGDDIPDTIQRMKEAIYTDGSVIAMMDVYEDFVFYQSGIYTHDHGSRLGSRAIVLVGWDDPGGYWIVKNSWGDWWGEDGYVRMAYSVAVGLYSYPAYAVLRTDYNGDGIWDGEGSPIARAGEDQTVHIGDLVTLDGSGSSDPEGDYPLRYSWSIVSKPAGSSAVLANPDTMSPSFTVDIPGDYEVSLIVTDSGGLASVPDLVTVSTTNSKPIAEAGPDQVIMVIGSTIQLDGTQSWDPDGDPLTYEWTLASRPSGSLAALSDPTIAMPTFIADVKGTYVAELVLYDPWAASDPDSVTISFENVAPLAFAGGNQSVTVGDTVFLNGIGVDANGDALTYRWSFVSKPEGSVTVLSSTDIAATSFVADVAGTYVVSLVVNDGTIDSSPSNATITAASGSSGLIQTLTDAIAAINNLSCNNFKNCNMRDTLTNKINVVLMDIERGVYRGALEKLQNDILKKTDGCANTGAPDKNDWITNCTAQEEVYVKLINAIALLEELIGG